MSSCNQNSTREPREGLLGNVQSLQYQGKVPEFQSYSFDSQLLKGISILHLQKYLVNFVHPVHTLPETVVPFV